MRPFKPFKEEATSLMLDAMTIENRIDRIELYGTLQITRDKAGLKAARSLKEVVDAAVAALEAETLPDQITIRPPDKVNNPFK